MILPSLKVKRYISVLLHFLGSIT